MSANNDIKQTINDLYEIQILWDEYLEKDEEYDNLETEKEEAEEKVARKWVDVGEKFDKEARKKLPKRATRPTGWSKVIPTPVLIDWENPKKTIIITAASRFISSYGILAVIVLLLGYSIVGGILSLIPFIGKILGFVVGLVCLLLAMGIFIACFANILYFNNDKNKENFSICLALGKMCKENENEEWTSKFNGGITDEAIENFYKEFQKYDAAFLSYVDDCKKKVGEIVTDYGEERSATTLKYLKAMQAKVDEIKPLLEEIENNTVLHTDYVPYAARLARLIESGRADTLKEAINLMLDDIRKDKEEAERRDEARRQEEETRRHNMAMQNIAEQEARDARAHNAAMEKAARDQAAAAKAQAAAAQAAANDARIRAQQAEKDRINQESRAKREASRRCNTCANAGKCSMFGMVNCAAFRPR